VAGIKNRLGERTCQIRANLIMLQLMHRSPFQHECDNSNEYKRHSPCFFKVPQLDAYNLDLVLEHHNHAKSRYVQAPTFLSLTLFLCTKGFSLSIKGMSLLDSTASTFGVNVLCDHTSFQLGKRRWVCFKKKKERAKMFNLRHLKKGRIYPHEKCYFFLNTNFLGN
jgi:hypothetical protein